MSSLFAGGIAACQSSPSSAPPRLAGTAVRERVQAACERYAAVVAHRGASAECPENTVAALRRAVELGAPIVEFDVHQTKDGVWVCLHDATCDRTTDARAVFGRNKVRVDQLTFAQVQQLDAGSWFDSRFAGERVPTLEQALAAILPAVPMIERKGGDAAALVDELARLEVRDQVLVQAFDWDWLQQVHERDPSLLLAALGSREASAERLADVARTGAEIVHWNHLDLTFDQAAAIRAHRLLCVYTVDAEASLLGCAAIGCDLITSNRPERLLALGRRGLLGR